MSLDLIADRVLAALPALAPETRYEEKFDLPTGIEGTNAALRRALGARGQVVYPSCGDLCDVVLDTSAGPAWIEVKHSWTWTTYRKPAGRNPNHRKHLLGDGNDSALHDARSKLPRLLGQPCASTIGMLVIALDSEQLRHKKEDIEELARRAGLDREPWKYFTLARWMSGVPGYASIGIQPHLWLRGATPGLACA